MLMLIQNQYIKIPELGPYNESIAASAIDSGSVVSLFAAFNTAAQYCEQHNIKFTHQFMMPWRL